MWDTIPNFELLSSAHFESEAYDKYELIYCKTKLPPKTAVLGGKVLMGDVAPPRYIKYVSEEWNIENMPISFMVYS